MKKKFFKKWHRHFVILIEQLRGKLTLYFPNKSGRKSRKLFANSWSIMHIINSILYYSSKYKVLKLNKTVQNCILNLNIIYQIRLKY